MAATFPSLSPSPPSDAGAGGLRARDPRTNTMLAAQIELDGERADVFLRDVSSTGASMEGPRLPAAGETVLLERGAIRVRANVVWRQERRCGINFERPVLVAEMMRRVGPGSSAQQARIDTVQRKLRAGTFVASPTADRVSPPTDLRADFGYACRLVEAVGDELTGDAYILSRYGSTLQKLDELMQLLKKIEARTIDQRGP